MDEVTREITDLGYTAFSMKQQFSFLNIFFNIIRAIFACNVPKIKSAIMVIAVWILGTIMTVIPGLLGSLALGG